jgi:hypothetical protein
MARTIEALPPVTSGELPAKRGGGKHNKRLIWGAAFLVVASLLVLTLLAIGKAAEMPTTLVSPTLIHGQVSPGFEAVEAEFRPPRACLPSRLRC